MMVENIFLSEELMDEGYDKKRVGRVVCMNDVESAPGRDVKTHEKARRGEVNILAGIANNRLQLYLDPLEKPGVFAGKFLEQLQTGDAVNLNTFHHFRRFLTLSAERHNRDRM